MGGRRLTRIQHVEPLHDRTVRIRFTDGSSRDLDLTPYLKGPVFDLIRTDPRAFRRVQVDPELGTIGWPNGADLDPDVLYGTEQPAWQEDPSS
jgi:hypothetical protein